MFLFFLFIADYKGNDVLIAWISHLKSFKLSLWCLMYGGRRVVGGGGRGGGRGADASCAAGYSEGFCATEVSES